MRAVRALERKESDKRPLNIITHLVKTEKEYKEYVNKHEENSENKNDSSIIVLIKAY